MLRNLETVAFKIKICSIAQVDNCKNEFCLLLLKHLTFTVQNDVCAECSRLFSHSTVAEGKCSSVFILNLCVKDMYKHQNLFY